MPQLVVIHTARRARVQEVEVDPVPVFRMGPRPVEVIDAGAVPTTGAPLNNQPAGTFEYATNILVQGVIPQIDPLAFGQRLAQTIPELVGGRASPSDVTITRGSQVITEVPGSVMTRLLPLVGLPALAAIGGPALATTATAAAISAAVAASTGRIPGYWVAIRGVFTAPTPWQVSSLNRAIARAFANTTTFGGPIPAFARRLPPQGDGSLLLARLSAPDACTGGADYTAVYARACTRVAPGNVMTPIAAPPTPSTPTPRAPTPTSTTPTSTTPTSTTPTSTTPTRTSTTPTRTSTTPTRTAPTPVAPQVLVPPPSPESKMKWYWWVLGGLAVGGLGVAVWKRHAIASWWKKRG